ncbi:MAG: 50S ribosomal protein L22 [Proteobacteria bacterium]|nr:50S ribosomal protein L22 [Pseudomonadota bacterium]
MGKKANTRKVKDNEAIAVARNLRTSPRKLNLLAQLIRGKKAAEALTLLSFDKHRMALDVKKTLQSAVANAENNHQLDVDRLIVIEASVGRAFVMKRYQARARGRGAGIEKPFSHLRVVVREEQKSEIRGQKSEKKQSQVKKPEAKTESKPAAKAPAKKSTPTAKAKKD